MGHSSPRIGIAGIGARALDAGIALFAGAAVAFAVAAAPAGPVGGLVAASGLPAILPQAAPPLGDSARLILASIGALAAFGLVFGLLALLSRPAARRRRRPAPDAVPTLRRADAHPDNPARRPIMAGLDLGDPVEPADEIADWEPAAPEAPFDPRVAAFLTDVPVDEEEADAEPEPEPVASHDEPEPEPAPGPVPPGGEAADPAAQSLAELVRRLERGLAAHGMAAPAIAAPSDTPPVRIAPSATAADPAIDPLDHVIADLERLVARR